jgi:hypothetical protein
MNRTFSSAFVLLVACLLCGAFVAGYVLGTRKAPSGDRPAGAPSVLAETPGFPEAERRAALDDLARREKTQRLDSLRTKLADLSRRSMEADSYIFMNKQTKTEIASRLASTKAELEAEPVGSRFRPDMAARAVTLEAQVKEYQDLIDSASKTLKDLDEERDAIRRELAKSDLP